MFPSYGKTSQLICSANQLRANQLTAFYMMGTLVVKGLKFGAKFSNDSLIYLFPKLHKVFLLKEWLGPILFKPCKECIKNVLQVCCNVETTQLIYINWFLYIIRAHLTFFVALESDFNPLMPGCNKKVTHT